MPDWTSAFSSLSLPIAALARAKKEDVTAAIEALEPAAYAVVGMGALLAATIYAPLTGYYSLVYDKSELEKAEASQTRALAINEKAYGPDHPQVAINLTSLGLVQRQRRRLAELVLLDVRLLFTGEFGTHGKRKGYLARESGLLIATEEELHYGSSLCCWLLAYRKAGKSIGMLPRNSPRGQAPAGGE